MNPTTQITARASLPESLLDDILTRLAVIVPTLVVVGAVLAVLQLTVGFGEFFLSSLQTFGPFVGFFLLLTILFQFYMEVIRRKYIAGLAWTFLQVRVPEANLRTPRAMEEVFNLLHGAQRPPDLYDMYLDGYTQSWFSAEIRGTPGSVSFVFRIPTGLRQMFEGTIYAQYPDAEILEAEDYAAAYTIEQLEQTFELWGTEIKLGKEDAYPIRTYVDFEDEFAEEGRLVDTMAAITENVSSISPNEEMWIQILFRPEIAGFTRPDWRTAGEKLALGLAGREMLSKPSRLQRIFAFFGRVVDVFIPGPQRDPRKRSSTLDLGVLRLTPGETDVVRAIQRNVSKVGFAVIIRAIALGPKGKFIRRTRISPILGMFRQFSTLNLNDFRPDGRFSTSRPTYGLSKVRQTLRKRRILRRYQER